MTNPFKENPFDKMTDKNLADVAKNIWDSKRNGERAESLIPYAEQISEAISGQTAEPLVSKNVCLDIAKDMFYDALCRGFCEVVEDKNGNKGECGI